MMIFTNELKPTDRERLIPIRKVDLHVHTSERSPCATSGEEEQIRAAIAAGLEAIFFTDHHRFIPLERLEILNREYAPFRVFGGIEVTSQGEDFILLGGREARLEVPDWPYSELHAWARANNAFIALAHPFRYHEGVQVDLERFPPDAIEVYSPNIRASSETHIRELAAHLNLPVLCNSDAHTSQRLGQYFNILEQSVFEEQDLFFMLKAGRFSCQKENQTAKSD